MYYNSAPFNTFNICHVRNNEVLIIIIIISPRTTPGDKTHVDKLPSRLFWDVEDTAVFEFSSQFQVLKNQSMPPNKTRVYPISFHLSTCMMALFSNKTGSTLYSWRNIGISEVLNHQTTSILNLI